MSTEFDEGDALFSSWIAVLISTGSDMLGEVYTRKNKEENEGETFSQRLWHSANQAR
jgi:hypothetical protein